MRYISYLLVLSVAFIAGSASAQRTITVSAEGSVESKPDFATVTMMVSTQDQTAQAVFARTEDNAAKLTKALTDAGVSASDIEAEGSALNPSYDYSGGAGGPNPHLAGYRMMNTYQVRVRSIKDLPKIIDAGTLAGATNVSISSYGIVNKDELEEQASKKAIAEAREKAERLAEQMGAKLGPIVSISDGSDVPAAAAGMGREEEEEHRGMIVSGSNSQRIKRSASFRVTFSVQ